MLFSYSVTVTATNIVTRLVTEIDRKLWTDDGVISFIDRLTSQFEIIDLSVTYYPIGHYLTNECNRFNIPLRQIAQPFVMYRCHLPNYTTLNNCFNVISAFDYYRR